jgi:GT2 family glycosyltransferase
LLNADAIMHSDCVKTLIEVAESDESYGVVLPTEYSEEKEVYALPHLNLSNKIYEDFEDRSFVRWGSFGCALLKRSTIDSIGYLNEDFPHRWSDFEYCKRVVNSGLKVVYSKLCGYTHSRHHEGGDLDLNFPTFLKKPTQIPYEKETFRFMMDLLVKMGLYTKDGDNYQCKRIRIKKLIVLIRLMFKESSELL